MWIGWGGSRGRRPDARGGRDGWPTPWAAGRPSIHAFLRDYIEPGRRGLRPGAEILPDDEEQARRDGRIRWAPGARDGVRVRHAAPGAFASPAPATAPELLAALKKAAGSRCRDAVARLYALLTPDDAIEVIDDFLGLVLREPQDEVARLPDLARWFATEAPDRGPVKVAIAVLGVFPDERNVGLFETLGRHDEFALFAGVALVNTLRDPEPALLELARNVWGWGRVQLVERLARMPLGRGTKDWLLREGYQNRVMDEYLAHACATAGGLREALAAASVDRTLLDGAGDILSALIRGGPAPGLEDYADGPEATRLYVAHVAREISPPLGRVPPLLRIAELVGDEEARRRGLDGRGWSGEARRSIGAEAARVLARPSWRAQASRGLWADDDGAFRLAAGVADALGIDTWTARFARQSAREDADEWFWLARLSGPGTIGHVVGLARRQLDLATIGSGPADELDLGPGFADHRALDFVLQELGRFPGEGWDLVEAGLRSPVVRNRHFALRALAAWPRNTWPREARPALKLALPAEPDDRVRERLRDLLGEAEP